ncbi:MAG: Uma2 family endonuclease [Panacagrimonas sp.]
MGEPLARIERYTYADYRGWGENVRGELIDGLFYDMSPAPAPWHQSISGELFLQIKNFLRDKRGQCSVFAAPFDVRFPRKLSDNEDDDDTVVQPDIVVICDKTRIDGRGCRGAPTFLIEILSPNTARKDLTVKRRLYERQGVAEFWLVYPQERIAQLYRLGADGTYGEPEIATAEDRSAVASLPELEIDWAEVFQEI